MNKILNFSGNIYSLRSGTHMSRPILHTTQFRTESAINLGQRYVTWYNNMLKKQTPYLVLKITLRSGYQKTVCAVFCNTQVGYI